MKRVLIALLASVTVAAASVGVPAPAEARNNGAAVAAGIVGGLAVGAILGSSMSRPAYAYPAYAPPPTPCYVVYESYRAPQPVACHGGYWSRRPVAFDAYGQPVAWSKPRFVCPSYY